MSSRASRDRYHARRWLLGQQCRREWNRVRSALKGRKRR